LGTKNVPDAINWHFAGEWGHIFKHVPSYSQNWATAWNKSTDLLYRSIALPIMVKRTEEEMARYADTVSQILKAV